MGFEICSGVWAAFINCTPSLSEKDAGVKAWIWGFGEALCAGREALGNLVMRGRKEQRTHGTGPALSTEEFCPGGLLVFFREMEFVCVL